MTHTTSAEWVARKLAIADDGLVGVREPATYQAMPMAEGYRFTVEPLPQSGLRIELLQLATGAIKVFRQATGSVAGLSAHMRSLTDTQCADWFKAGRKK